MLEHKSVTFWSVVAQLGFRRGSARAYDHAQLIQRQWLQAAVLGMKVYVQRVSTNDNIADLPSRGVRSASYFFVFLWHAVLCQELDLLKRMGAVEVTPRLRNEYLQKSCWEILHERWQA